MLKLLMPVDYWSYHHKDCGNKSRGCVDDCPKDLYEKTGKWIGPTRLSIFFNDIRKAFGKLFKMR